MIAYRPTASGGWEAICTDCSAVSLSYPVKSMARQWGRDHECVGPEGDAA